MKAWAEAVSLPVLLALAQPLIIAFVARLVFSRVGAGAFMIMWPCSVAFCAVSAGWRVVRSRSGASDGAALGGLFVLPASMVASIVVALAMLSWGRAHLSGLDVHFDSSDLIVWVILGLCACWCGALLGHIGGRAATRWGPGNAA